MSAPGYQSWAWTQQDWRTVQLHADGSWSYDRACGDGSTLPSGRKRLCLPRTVLDALARSAEGRRIVREQAQRKQGAKPGTRVQWHPKIRSLVMALDARTPADRKQRRNPMARKTHPNLMWDGDFDTHHEHPHRSNPMRIDKPALRRDFNTGIDGIVEEAGMPGVRLDSRREVREWVSAQYDDLLYSLADLYGVSVSEVKRIVGGSFKRETQNDAVNAWAWLNE